MKRSNTLLPGFEIVLALFLAGCLPGLGPSGKASGPKEPSAEAWAQEGIALVQDMRYEEGIAAFTKALALKPNHAETLYNRGYAYRMAGDLDRALADFRAASELRPDDPKIRAAREVVEDEILWQETDRPYFHRQLQQSPGE